MFILSVRFLVNHVHTYSIFSTYLNIIHTVVVVVNCYMYIYIGLYCK